MKYDRLTKHETDNVVSINGRIFYDEPMASIIDRLAELEDKIEDGCILELPCKVGDAVYVILGNKIYEDSVKGFNYVPSDYGLRFVLSFSSPVVEYLGDKLFFTREEAEARLKELMWK